MIFHFFPRYTNANISANGGIKTSILYTAKDYNDINSPANADEVAAYRDWETNEQSLLRFYTYRTYIYNPHDLANLANGKQNNQQYHQKHQ